MEKRKAGGFLLCSMYLNHVTYDQINDDRGQQRDPQLD